MKKVFFLIMLLLGTSVLSTAGEIPGVSQMSTNVPVPVNATPDNGVSIEEENNLSDAESQKKKKKKKKMKTWHYIASGAFLVLVIVIYVLTGGEGWSSR